MQEKTEEKRRGGKKIKNEEYKIRKKAVKMEEGVGREIKVEICKREHEKKRRNGEKVGKLKDKF
jgi:hypothetical protein